MSYVNKWVARIGKCGEIRAKKEKAHDITTIIRNQKPF
jgi:hypothetical protein